MFRSQKKAMKRPYLIFVALISCFPQISRSFPEYVASPIFHVETSGPLATTIAYPLFKNRLLLGVRQTEPGHDHCPVITFTNSVLNRTAEPNLNVYFCNDFFGIFNGWDGVYGVPYKGPNDSEYRGIWIYIDQVAGQLIIGLRDLDEPLHIFNFARKDETIQKFYSHFALGGFGRWIVEKKSTFVIGESTGEECSTSYYPLPASRIYFGIRYTRKPSETCPRIQFHTSPKTNGNPYLGIHFCSDEYSFRNKNEILDSKNESLVSRDNIAAYWIHLDQAASTLSIGRASSEKPFHKYNYTGSFPGLYFSHFAFVGYVHVYFKTDGQELLGMN